MHLKFEKGSLRLHVKSASVLQHRGALSASALGADELCNHNISVRCVKLL